ncbi:MAG: aldolase catalytic domain-containing protein [Treponema sp.]|nr:aldolase catalytic domain-containing protein [Treponema sp.]
MQVSEKKINLLDCTLRDGGYINEWKWGFDAAKEIINTLSKSGVDVIEVGFLRNITDYDENVTVSSNIEDLNKLLPVANYNTTYCAMAMRSNYDIQKLADYSGRGIELIRVTFHDYDIEEGLDFARQVQKKGYKVSINPINIMGYSDEEILKLVKRVNDINPYQFSIVDTFGSMKKKDMERIVGIVDNNLSSLIRLGLHLHENLSLSFMIAQLFIDMHLKRNITVDGSLMGMGRIPGNLPLELISDYVNDNYGSSYDIDYMMDMIQSYILPIKGEISWGYTPAYFLSAKYNLHRNYAEYYLNKGDITNRDVNFILSRISKDKTTVFDSNYAEECYLAYKKNRIEDTESRAKLYNQLKDRLILILSPGASLKTHNKEICEFIEKTNPIIISVNFSTELYKQNYVFIGNNKRLEQLNNCAYPMIATSNLVFNEKYAFYLDYNSLCSNFLSESNSLVMLLKLMKDLQFTKVFVAGADGYSSEGDNYFQTNLRKIHKDDISYNKLVKNAIEKLNMDVRFITPSAYSN